LEALPRGLELCVGALTLDLGDGLHPTGDAGIVQPLTLAGGTETL
jgi:hypothetical protein